MSFWESRTGEPITGNAKDAFSPEFTIIPDGSTCCASLFDIDLIEKEATDYAEEQKFYEVTWKITTGDFKNRQVKQKLKVFNGTEQAINRNLNMMKLMMDLCGFKPSHSNAPSVEDLSPMIGKILGVKIGEWSLPKRDGSGLMEGNFIREISAANEIKDITAVKSSIPPYVSTVDTAFSRNPKGKPDVFEGDIPF